MAEGEGKILSTIAELIEKFINNYMFWLWLTIFAALLIIFDKIHIIALSQITHDYRSIVIAILLFGTCMFLNGSNVATHLFDYSVQQYKLFSESRAEKEKKREESKEFIRNLEETRKCFNDIMTTDCKERDWLLWYIFVFRHRSKKYFIFVSNLLSNTEYGLITWKDPIAQRLYAVYHLLKEYKGDGIGLTYGDTAFCESMSFDVAMRLLTDGNEELKKQLRVERDRVVSAVPEDASFKTYGDMFREPRIYLESAKPWFLDAQRNLYEEEDLLKVTDGKDTTATASQPSKTG